MSQSAQPNISSGQPERRLSIGASTKSTNASHRFSVASTETGESSKRNSSVIENNVLNFPDISAIPVAIGYDGHTSKSGRDGKPNHRSHRSRGSASFLVSNAIFEQPAIAADASRVSPDTLTGRLDLPRDNKGKVVIKSPDRHHKKNRSSVGLGIGASPLATIVLHATTEHEESIDETAGNALQNSNITTSTTKYADTSASTPLDMKSAQIVNLALNLSESRRNAARRNISSPVPPTITGFSESFSGGSLRQHLQAQRRSSRNISPKPEKGDRAFATAPRVVSGQGPGTYSHTGTYQDSDYKYHFSASTLARAEKAKKALQLMALYRELLQYVPPLKSQGLTRISTKSPPNTATGFPTNSGLLSHARSITGAQRQLGRPYNPLQYIRNRKVRARERKTIDGESQGFGDVEKVAKWVEQISKESTHDEYQTSDCVALPPFASAHETVGDANTSPKSVIGRSHGNIPRVKRPRMDWIINPADMLADVYWLEQDGNKKLIEDNRERKIFPQEVELTRSVSYLGEEPAQDLKIKEDPFKKLSLDTRLSKFSSLRNSGDTHSDSPSQKARHKLKNTTYLRGGTQPDGREHVLSKLHHSSTSESSESEKESRQPKHRRNATAGSHDLNSDILEKQMLEIIAKESRKNVWETSYGEKAVESTQSPKLSPVQAVTENSERLNYAYRDKEGIMSNSGDDRERRGSNGSQLAPGRASLEVPESRGRQSLDGLDTTAPNSPHATATNIPALFVPSIAIDLSPPSTRQSSPIRQPTLEKVKSIINPFYDHSHNRSHSRTNSVTQENRSLEENKKHDKRALEVPSTPDGSRRSSSPANQNLRQKTEDNMQNAPPPTAGSIRRKAEELPSGLRSLFKGGRNSVQRVSDFIWKKEMSPGSGVSSNTSSDDSDVEEARSSISVPRTTAVDNTSEKQSRGAPNEPSMQRETRSYELPTFSSPFERRGRSGAPAEDMSPESDYAGQRQRARQQRQLWRFEMLKPPRIDVQTASPSSSPDLPPIDRSSRNSELSDLESRYHNSQGVQNADARLNSVLGIPGHVSHAGKNLPVTGLTHPQDSRRPSAANNRQWSISDRAVSAARGPISKREIARVQALLLSSGIKAKEITRAAGELKDLHDARDLVDTYADIVSLNRDPKLLKPVPRSQVHILAAQILSRDIHFSSQMWQESASRFSSESIDGLLDRVEGLQNRITSRSGLSELTRGAEREADDVLRDLVTTKTMAVKGLLDRMDYIMRKRRRRFRHVRRVGWVTVEWVLIGVMWVVWAVVMVITFLRGTVRGIIGGLRWLLWL